MSRFVRASKYRHVYGQPAKKENGYENIKLTNSAWDTNIISASAKYISINWNASGGGAFAILPLPSPFVGVPDFPFKIPDQLPLARSHTAPVLDTDWSPHDDSIVASAGEDGKVNIWKVDAAAFEGWGSDGWAPSDFDPVSRIDASPRKVGQVLFNPTAKNVLASASGEYTVKLWDLSSPESAQVVLSGHQDTIQSLAFNPTGTLLVTTSRDRRIRLFDPRAGGDPVRVSEGHGGIKGSRVTWMGDTGRIATTGFSKMSDRQVALWDSNSLASVKMITLDQTSGVVMPFWSDNNILFLAGKGDGNIRFFEYEADNLFPLSEHKSSDPQRGMAFLPRRALNVSDCEIARAYKVHGSSVEPIAFIVPRKSDSFQSDIFPPAPSIEPSATASEFFNSKNDIKRNIVDLEHGKTSTDSAKATPVPAASPAPVATPSRASTISTPEPVRETKVEAKPEPKPEPKVEPKPEPKVEPKVVSKPEPVKSDDSGLKEENARLNAELREAREKIRNLELQVESQRANARRIAQSLLEQ